jgi:diguanylate cyclase (GGDEF)-like protein
MDVLGDGEKPIHHDIDAGAAAVRGLLVSSLTFIAYLIAVGFWREWVKRRRERLRYEGDLRLHRLAHMDSLTGLANRVLLDDRISVAIAAAHRYSHRLGILYLDLDGFKQVNDELGHDAGDSVLKEVALRLQKHVREMDTVARVGGDEFVVLLTNLRDRADARVATDKLQAALDQPFELRGRPCPLRASVGVAIFPDDGEQPVQLLKHADDAMYETKRMTKLNAASLRTERKSQYSTRQRIA